MLIRHFNTQYNFETLPANKVLLLFGGRRAGKTTAIQKLAANTSNKSYITTGEDLELQRILATESVSEYKRYFGNYDLLIIDEAQAVPNIGIALKLLVDTLSDIKIIASGSSSFNLANLVSEPLVGRYEKYTMYPISYTEYTQNYSPIEAKQYLNQFLVFGSYPETFGYKSDQEKANYLNNLLQSFLFKDILLYQEIRNSNKLTDLLRLLAFQIGNEVSLNELANKLGISKQTVQRYLDLLEKSFVIIKVDGFARNLRKEINKTKRYYFYDNGVLNAILRNFNPIEVREDVGRLWENFLFIERMKANSYNNLVWNYYFWRTYDQKEIDLIEERDGKLFGYEFKWGNKTNTAPSDWKETYPGSEFTTINQNNYSEFIQ